MTPKDLEAEIAASASAISGYETVGGKTHETPKKKPAAKKTSSKKKKSTKTPVKKKLSPKKTAATPKPKQKKGKVMATSDVKPVPKPKKKPPTVAEVKSDDTKAPTAVRVNVKPKSSAASTSKTKSRKAPILNHQGKTLQPIGGATQKAKPPVVKPVKRKQTGKPVAIKTETRVARKTHVEESDKPYQVIKNQPAKAKPDVKAEVQAPKAGASKLHNDSPHVARIYDTRTYHIPLSVDHHHRKAMLPRWAQVSVLLAGAGALVAAFILGM